MKRTTKIKIALWIPYCLTMMFLAWMSFWIRTNTCLDFKGSVSLLSFICLHSAMMVGSADLRRHFWPDKTGNVNIKKIFCFFRGHDFVSYQLDNRDVFEGVWRSAWGNHTCVRCGKEIDWQWDRP